MENLTFNQIIDKIALVFNSIIHPNQMQELMTDIVNYISVSEPLPIEFINKKDPSIENYDRDYAAAYGQLPTFQLFTINANDNLIPRSETPEIIRSEGRIIRIVYDLPDFENGFIKITK